jgi:flagellar protein FlaF
MYDDPRRAYETAAKATTSSRELEAAALFKAARMLEDCHQAWSASDRDQRLQTALRYNQRLWTFFQAELSDPESHLPVDLRVGLLRLSTFVDRRTFELLAQPDREKLRALIDIDRNIAVGLSVQVPEEPRG